MTRAGPGLPTASASAVARTRALRRYRATALIAGALTSMFALALIPTTGAGFTTSTANPGNAWTGQALDGWTPTSVTASRTAPTTCLVSWTPRASPPAGLTYDVTDGNGSTLVTGVTGSSISITVASTSVTPTVRARIGTWTSAAEVSAAGPCDGLPAAPGGLTLAPADGQIAVSWTAPAGNGGTIASYAVTTSPSPATCSTTAPTTSCLLTGLTNGLTHTVSVTATSNVGTGPAASADAIPYPSGVMAAPNLRLWLDGAEATTMYASDTCTGAGATTTVGCWKDKSAGATHLTQAAGGNRPGLAAVAGRSVPDFDGTSSYLTGGVGNLPVGSTASTTFLAGRLTDPTPAASDYRVALSWGTLSPNRARQVYKSHLGTTVAADVLGGGVAESGSWTGDVDVVTAEHTAASTSLWTRGKAAATTAAVPDTGSTFAVLGRQGTGPQFYWQGQVPEVIVLAGTVSASQRRDVEDYLARKWSASITPRAPTGVTAAPDGTSSVGVAWTAPAWDGGSAITDYLVEYRAYGSGSWNTWAHAASTATSATITGLDTRLVYEVRVSAVNAVGTGPASAPATSVPLWSPALLGSAVAFWVDADDAATLTTSGGNVATWADKSGHARDAAQGTGAARPALVAGALGGRPAVTFDGTDDVLPFDGSFLAGSDYTVTAAVSRTAANGRYYLAGADNGPVNTNLHVGWRSDTQLAHAQWSNDCDTAVPAYTAEIAEVHTFRHSSNTGKATWRNGTPGCTSASTAPLTSWNGASIGRRYGNGFFQGRVGEIVMTTTAVSTTDRQKLEGYLSWKWGSQSSLPADHPYRTSPPTTTGTTPTAPLNVATTAGDTTSSVTWRTPAWHGGSAVAGYTVTAVPADGTLPTRTCSAASSPCTLTGLTNGGTYAVTVTATSPLGTGSASTAVTVIPYPAGVLNATDVAAWYDATMASTLLTAGGAAATTGQSVATWKDRSGKGVHTTQSTAANQGVVDSINGKPAWKGDGGDWLASAATGTFRTVFTVADPSRPVYWATLFAAPANTDFSQRTVYAELVPANSDDWHTGAGGGYWTNSVAAGSAGAGGPAVYVSQASVGVTGTAGISSSFLDRGLVGSLGEIVVLNTAPSAADRRVVEEYLARTWGVTISPAAPGPPTAVAGDGQASVSWTAPSWNGGAAITGYTVTASPGGATCTTATLGCTVTGLTNGTSYTVTVTATNSVGVGPSSAPSNTVTPVGPPGAPTGVASPAADTTSSVSWSAPANDGGSPITTYTATAVPSDGGLPARTCSAASSPCTITGLTNGITYTVTVTAANALGTGPASTASSVLPYPTSVMTGAAVTLWLDGADSSTLLASSGCTGAAATTTVGCWKDKSASSNHATQPAGSVQPALGAVGSHGAPTFDGVDDGMTFNPALLPTGTSTGTQFAVAALTDAAPAATGWRTILNYGTASNTQKRFLGKEGGSDKVWFDTHSTGWTTPGSWPNGQPAVVVAEAASASTRSTMNGKAWTAPTPVAFDTGTTLGQLGFGAATWNGPIAEVIVLDTTLSDAHRREVEEYLARKWGVPITPSAPAAVVADDGDGEALVTWTAPAWDGGAPITGHTATASPGGQTCTAADDDTTCTITGLTNGTTYTVTVTATNAVGTGPASVPSAGVTPQGPLPSAPTLAGATAGDGQVALTWTTPASTGSTPLTGYTVSYTYTTALGAVGSGSVGVGVQTAYTWTGLTNGYPYLFTVKAVNAGGSGPSSSSRSATPYPAGVMTSGATRLWLDGADSSTLLASSGCTGAAATTTVGCWKDKSASATNATQSTPANQPTLTTAGGRSVPGFDGSNDYLSFSAASLPTGTNASSTFVAARLTDPTPAASSYRVALAWGTANYGQGRNTLKAANSGAVAVDTWAWGTVYPGTWSSGGGVDIVSGQHAAATVSAWLNSAQPGASTSQAFTTGSSYGRVGNQQNGTETWHGPIPEIIVLNTALTSAERRQVEEYLARKWGVTLTPGTPGTPTAVAGNAQATVSWAAPSWNGGSAITAYTVTASPGGATCATATTGCTVSGLANGTAYTFTVTATSIIGTGPASAASNSVTPTAPGYALAWAGSSARGQGGGGTADTLPTQVGTGTTWSGTDAGDAHSCGVRSDGTLWCWGNGANGRLGLGSTSSASTPTQVGTATTWASVSAGTAHTCAVRADGTLWCWGSNPDGRLGDGTTTQRTSPVQVGVATTWTAVSAGDAHTCATQADATLWCWGNPANGRLGNGVATGTFTSPVQIGAATWTGVTAGNAHTCGVESGGSLWCWGNPGNGRLGNGVTAGTFNSPVQIGSVTTWAQVSAGTSHTCATRTDGTLWCWGSNTNGRLGDGGTTQRTSPVREAASATTWSSVSAGGTHSCGRRTNGTIWCWGTNTNGQVGDGTMAARKSPVQLGAATTWGSVSAGTRHTCAPRADGTIWCWGDSTDARTGYDPVFSALTPAGAATTWTSVVAGADFACGLRSDGTLWCWGSNDFGQLGLGDHADRSAPTHVGSATTWQALSAGTSHACGLQSDGSLWCWGDNGYDQLGTGDATERTVPTHIGSATWASIAAGEIHTCGVRTDGTLWCWGENTDHQLGDGTTTSAPVPMQIGAVTTWNTASAGVEHTCATRTDGTLWCWGSNGSGEIGDGTTTPRPAPVPVGAATWSRVSAGAYHTCGVQTNGTAWCWGGDSSGELGFGSAGSSSLSPRQLGAATTWQGISTRMGHTCGIRVDGTLWCWGANTYGQLGTGDVDPRYSMTQIDAGASVGAVAVGGTSTPVILAATPGAPTTVTATSGNTTAAVSWTVPRWSGTTAITAYTATAAPGGGTCTAAAPATNCTISGLTNDTTYTVTVTATNAGGTGPASAPSDPVTPLPAWAGATNAGLLTAYSGAISFSGDVTATGDLWSWGSLTIPHNASLNGDLTSRTSTLTVGGAGYTATAVGTANAGGTAALGGVSSTLTGHAQAWNNVQLEGTVLGSANSQTGSVVTCTKVRDACTTGEGLSLPSAPSSVTYDWNPANYAAPTSHADGTALNTWMTTHANAVSGAHYVWGGATITSNLVITGDTTIVSQTGPLVFNGTITTTSSTPVRLVVVSGGAVTFAGAVDSGQHLGIGVDAWSTVQFNAATTLRGWVLSEAGDITFASTATLTHVPVRDPGHTQS